MQEDCAKPVEDPQNRHLNTVSLVNQDCPRENTGRCQLLRISKSEPKKAMKEDESGRYNHQGSN